MPADPGTGTGSGAGGEGAQGAQGGQGGEGAQGGDGAQGGEGGQGGQGGDPCNDPVAGAPTVTSDAAMMLLGDVSGGVYQLTFSESVSNVDASLAWVGPGQLDGVTQVDDQTYDVAFSGLDTGEHAVLLVGTGVEDGCGNTLADGVPITIGTYANCHLFHEDFEDNFLSIWTTADDAGDGNLWATNFDFAEDNVVALNQYDVNNLTCAMANDDFTGATDWDSTLASPAIDLTNVSNAVLVFASEFDVYSTYGEATLDVSTDGGANWTEIFFWDTDHSASIEFHDLSAFVGGDVTLRWRYSDEQSSGAWYWAIDDVCVSAYTLPACSCPAGAYTESADTLGGADGNGTMATAEASGGTLTAVADAVSVCGTLEDELESGPDYFQFAAAGSGLYSVTVDYCVEAKYAPVTIELRDYDDAVIASEVVAESGTFTATLNSTIGTDFYVVVREDLGSFAATDYAITVTLDTVDILLMYETFDTDAAMSWFTITDSGADGNTWEWYQYGNYTGSASGGGRARIYDFSDSLKDGEFMDTPQLDATGYNTVTLDFDQDFDDYDSCDDEASVEVSTDGGANWTVIDAWAGADEYGVHETLDLTAAVCSGGCGTFVLRFAFDDNTNDGTNCWANDWNVDDIIVSVQ